MLHCPHCKGQNLTETVNVNVKTCNDCGAEFKKDYVFKEGSYKNYLTNILSKIQEEQIPVHSKYIQDIKLNLLDDKENIYDIIGSLSSLAETLQTGNVMGIDRKDNVIAIVEGLEKIFDYAKIMTSRKEISERLASRLALLEDLDVSAWQYPPEEIPDLPGEINDAPIDSDIASVLSSEEPLDNEIDDENWQDANWKGDNIKYSVTEVNGNKCFNIKNGNGDYLIKYNDQTNVHEGLENYTEEEISQLDDLINSNGSDGEITSTVDSNPADIAAEQTEKVMETQVSDIVKSNAEKVKSDGKYTSIITNLKNKVKRNLYDPVVAAVSFDPIVKSVCGTHCSPEDIKNTSSYLASDFENSFVHNQYARLEEREIAKFKGHDVVKKPEIPKVKKTNGESPDGHVVKYVKTVKDESKTPDKQYSQEEADIPFTQECAKENTKVDEKGIKKKESKKEKVEESQRFNGYHIGDKIKVNGYNNTFTLDKISNNPVKFHLSEGQVRITLDPLVDQYELEADRDLAHQRLVSIMDDTRREYLELEKKFEEGCVGGVCSMNPMSPQNNTSGIGASATNSTVISMSPIAFKTPIRSYTANDIYAYIKNNDLHNAPRQQAIGNVLSNFQDRNLDIDKIYEDAVLSNRYSSDQINEVDACYGYKQDTKNEFELRQQLNEGYAELKRKGIV